LGKGKRVNHKNHTTNMTKKNATIVVKVGEIKSNPNNPRIIKDEKFHKLVQSIKDFPKMLELRPVVLNKDMIILGGNMRWKAAKEAGLKELPVVIADDLTEKEQREFTIKDNVSFGDWDWDVLANDWDENELNDWGLEVPLPATDIDFNEFFEQSEPQTYDIKKKIVLEYTDEEYTLVLNELLKHGSSPESAVFNLLGL